MFIYVYLQKNKQTNKLSYKLGEFTTITIFGSNTLSPPDGLCVREH